MVKQIVKAGDVVKIHNCTFSGKPIIEGKAKLIRKVNGGIWMVEFLDTPGKEFKRFVDEEYQE
jgi:hypothetical protein